MATRERGLRDEGTVDRDSENEKGRKREREGERYRDRCPDARALPR